MTTETKTVPDTQATTPSATDSDPIGEMLDKLMGPVEAPPEEDSTSDAEAQPKTESPESDKTGTTTEPTGKAKPSLKLKGPSKPQDIEHKIKGLEKGFYKVTRENAELRKELQKLTGTDQPTHEDTNPDQIADRAARQALERSSLERAKEEFGDEYIQEQIFAEDSPYRKLVEEKPWVRERVLSHHDPIFEALKALKEHELLETYGYDIELVKNTLKEQLRAELQKELKLDKGLVGKRPPSLSGARAASMEPSAPVSSDVDLDALNPSLSAIA